MRRNIDSKLVLKKKSVFRWDKIAWAKERAGESYKQGEERADERGKEDQERARGGGGGRGGARQWRGEGAGGRAQAPPATVSIWQTERRGSGCKTATRHSSLGGTGLSASLLLCL